MGQKLGVSEENGRDKIRNVDPFIIFSFLIYGKTSEMPKEKKVELSCCFFSILLHEVMRQLVEKV